MNGREVELIEKSLKSCKEILRSRPALAKTYSIIKSHPKGISVIKIAIEQGLNRMTIYGYINKIKQISEKEDPIIKEEFNRNLSNVMKSGIRSIKKKNLKSIAEFKRLYPKDKKILNFLLSHPEGWTMEDVAIFFNFSKRNAWYKITNLKCISRETTSEKLSSKINIALSYFKRRYKHSIRVSRVINSVEELNKFHPTTGEIISYINSSPGKITIKELDKHFKLHKVTIRYHLKRAKEFSERSDNNSFKEYINQALQKVEVKKLKNRKAYNSLSGKSPKITREEFKKKSESIAGETKGIVCPECKTLLVQGKCIRCGKVWKQTKTRVIVYKAKDYKETRTTSKGGVFLGGETEE